MSDNSLKGIVWRHFHIFVLWECWSTTAFCSNEFVKRFGKHSKWKLQQPNFCLVLIWGIWIPCLHFAELLYSVPARHVIYKRKFSFFNIYYPVNLHTYSHALSCSISICSWTQSWALHMSHGCCKLDLTNTFYLSIAYI